MSITYPYIRAWAMLCPTEQCSVAEWTEGLLEAARIDDAPWDVVHATHDYPAEGGRIANVRTWHRFGDLDVKLRDRITQVAQLQRTNRVLVDWVDELQTDVARLKYRVEMLEYRGRK